MKALSSLSFHCEYIYFECYNIVFGDVFHVLCIVLKYNLGARTKLFCNTTSRCYSSDIYKLVVVCYIIYIRLLYIYIDIIFYILE